MIRCTRALLNLCISITLCRTSIMRAAGCCFIVVMQFEIFLFELDDICIYLVCFQLAYVYLLQCYTLHRWEQIPDFLLRYSFDTCAIETLICSNSEKRGSGWMETATVVHVLGNFTFQNSIPLAQQKKLGKILNI